MDTILFTDGLREDYFRNLQTDEEKRTRFPKFHQVRILDPKPTTIDIFRSLGGVQGWVNSEIQEGALLSRESVIPTLAGWMNK